jgi:hypothetical protein
MANFDLKKFIAANKATFHSSLSEGKKQYYKDAEKDDAEHIKALEKDMKDDKKSSKMTKEELKTKIKEMVLSEMGNTKDFASTSTERPDGTFDISGIMKELNINIEDENEMYDPLYEEDDEYYDPDEEQRYDEEDMPRAYYPSGEPIEEADEEEETETKEKVDVDVEDPEPAPEEGEMDVEANAEVELTGAEKKAQENLEAALAAAKEMGDQKLVDQIGNSITFFTRQHIVKENKINESTELVDKGGFKFDRFSGGEKYGPSLQITTPGMTTISPNFIQIPGSKLGIFLGALEDAIRVFDDMKRQGLN